MFKTPTLNTADSTTTKANPVGFGLRIMNPSDLPTQSTTINNEPPRAPRTKRPHSPGSPHLQKKTSRTVKAMHSETGCSMKDHDREVPAPMEMHDLCSAVDSLSCSPNQR